MQREKLGQEKENTRKFYEAMGEKNGYRYATQNKTPFTEYPARLCSILEYTGADGKTYDDWFLPSFGEIGLMVKSLDINEDINEGETSRIQNFSHSSVSDNRNDTIGVLYYSPTEKKWSPSWPGVREKVSAFIRPIRAF